MKSYIILGLLLGALTASVFGQGSTGSLDLRSVTGDEYVTPVKRQMASTCWTFSVMASMESNLMMSGAWTANGEEGVPDLAEYHLDWWNGFNTFFNDDLDPPDGGTGLTVHLGGDYRFAAAYNARGEGIVRDVDAPTFYDAPLRDDSTYHHYYARDIEWYTMGDSLEGIEVIKSAIGTHGALSTCFCSLEDYIYDVYYYQPSDDDTPPDRGVAIIGWDDHKTTGAEEKGAWLCKNSQGDTWLDEGFFYISYYDRWCCRHPDLGAVSFQNVEPLRYDHIYYHDYHGWQGTYTLWSEVINAFEPTGDEWLESVSFYTAADAVTYTVKIYAALKNAVPSGEIISVTDQIPHKGFHTVDLPSPVALEAGTPFYIYLSLSDGGQAVDKTADVEIFLGINYMTHITSTADGGESYYRFDGEWYDLHDYDFTANFCIKGLANPRTKALGMTCRSDVPAYLAPDEEHPLTVEISAAAESYVAGSALLHYRFDGGEYQTAPLSALGDDTFEAVLPAGACYQHVDFYFTAEGDGGTLVTDPLNAPALCYGADLQVFTAEWADDFETDQGWTVSGNATAGHWELGTPVGEGDRGDPPADFDGSGQCYLTGNTDGDSDVDNGYSYLETPMIDLTGSDALVHYAVWYSNNTSGDPNNDVFRVWVTNDMGITYIPVETIGPVTVNRWKEYSFRISDFVTPSVYTRVRFEVSDLAGASIVEAGLDDFYIYTLDCGFTFTRGDANGDAAIDVADAVYVINFVFKGGPPPDPLDAGDANCDTECNVGDAVYLINYIFKSGPAPVCP